MTHLSSSSTVTERVLRVRLPGVPLLCRGGLGAERNADAGRTKGDRGGVPVHTCRPCGYRW